MFSKVLYVHVKSLAKLYSKHPKPFGNAVAAQYTVLRGSWSKFLLRRNESLENSFTNWLSRSWVLARDELAVNNDFRLINMRL